VMRHLGFKVRVRGRISEGNARDALGMSRQSFEQLCGGPHGGSSRIRDSIFGSHVEGLVRCDEGSGGREWRPSGPYGLPGRTRLRLLPGGSSATGLRKMSRRFPVTYTETPAENSASRPREQVLELIYTATT